MCISRSMFVGVFAAKKEGVMTKRWYAIAVLVVLAAVVAAGTVRVRAAEEDAGSDKLAVVWTSGDPDVAHRICFMYTHAAKRNGWFDEIRFVVWGPSQRLLVADKDILAKVKAMQKDGVVVEAVYRVCDELWVGGEDPGVGYRSQSYGRAAYRVFERRVPRAHVPASVTRWHCLDHVVLDSRRLSYHTVHQHVLYSVFLLASIPLRMHVSAHAVTSFQCTNP